MNATTLKLIRAARQPLITVILSLIVAASAASYGVSQLFHANGFNVSDDVTSRFEVFLITGFIVIVMYTLALLIIRRLAVMPKKAFTATAFGTLALCIALLIFYPLALYANQPYTLGGFIGDGDPNGTGVYLWSAISICVLLVFIGAVVYARLVTFRQSKNVKRIQKSHAAGITLGVGIVIVCIAIIAPSAFLMPLFLLLSFTGAFSFITLSPSAAMMLFFLLVAVWIACTTIALRTVTQDQSAKAIVYRASLVWVLFALAISIQVIWLIYMWVMIALWPLKTISPSGK